MIEGKKIGFALTGSFCTFDRVIAIMEKLIKSGAEIYPIMSENAFNTSTRFGAASAFIHRIEGLCGRKIISTIVDAEPIGPNQMFDLLLIAPCTGNTLAKLALGITDTAVTMAAKSHLRGRKPVLIAVSTNDGLSNSAKNIGMLMNIKSIYFVPYSQDDYMKKPTSLVADMEQIPACILDTLLGKQSQPVLMP